MVSNIEMKYMACWYIPEYYRPTHKEAKQRLDYVNKHGYTPYDFSFKDKFSKEDFLNYKLIL